MGYIKLSTSFFENPDRHRPFLLGISNRDLSINYKNSVLNNGTEFFSLQELEKYLDKSKSSRGLSICIDASKKEIKLYRDLFGEIPIYYFHIPNCYFAFSTSLGDLVQMKEVKSYLDFNPNQIARYLSRNASSYPYSSDTFYKQIQSLLPGHKLIVTRNQTVSEPYTTFEPKLNHNLVSKEEYGVEFYKLLRRAVDETISDNAVIGSHLSGGLDSSSISTMIRHLYPKRELHTFYGNTNTSLSDEHHYAMMVVNSINSKHHTIDTPDNEIDKLNLHTSIYGYPLNKMHSPSRQDALIRNIKEVGCDILLAGEGGDSIMGYGTEYVGSLFNQKKWNEVKNEFSTLALSIEHPFFHKNWISLSNSEKINYYTKETLYTLLSNKYRHLPIKDFLPLFMGVCSEFGIEYSYFLKKGFTNLFKGLSNNNSILSSELVEINQKLNNTSPIKILGKNIDRSYQSSFNTVFSSGAIKISEDYYAISNYYNLTTRFPFYNQSLFEMSLATPFHIKYDNGLRRGHLRQAMTGILPDKVRLRIGKAAFDLFARQSALRLHSQSQDLLTSNNEVWQYVEKRKFDQVVKVLKTENQFLPTYTSSFFHVNRTIFLAAWLDWYKRL